MDGRTKRHDPTISIHALREEGDQITPHKLALDKTFLSTPSARRATLSCLAQRPSERYFYPRPPRGGRRLKHSRPVQLFQISIHALREEGDPRVRTSPDALREFLSTPSARRATMALNALFTPSLFLSTPSARRATLVVSSINRGLTFLSTPSARRATARIAHF